MLNCKNPACEKEFKPRISTQVYCSKECRLDHWVSLHVYLTREEYDSLKAIEARYNKLMKEAA